MPSYYHTHKEERKAYQRNYDSKHKDVKKKYKKSHRDAHLQYMRKYNRKHVYGITNEMFQQMILDQGGVCAICKNHPNGKGFHVDHNHKTGKIRKLLCQSCNLAIGHAHENVSILQKMIDYIIEES